MPMYKPQPPDDDLRRATGDIPFGTEGGVRFESATLSSYALAQQGVVTESAVALPVHDAGDLLQTSMGDYVAVNDARIQDDGTIETYQYTGLDVGAQVLVTVGDEQPTTDPVAAESAPNTDPLDTDSSAPVAFSDQLPAEQFDPSMVDISIGSSFNDDPEQAISGLASAVAVLNTGAGEVAAS